MKMKNKFLKMFSVALAGIFLDEAAKLGMVSEETAAAIKPKIYFAEGGNTIGQPRTFEQEVSIAERKGLKRFDIAGETVFAVNYKNAVKKAKKLQAA